VVFVTEYDDIGKLGFYFLILFSVEYISVLERANAYFCYLNVEMSKYTFYLLALIPSSLQCIYILSLIKVCFVIWVRTTLTLFS